MRLRALNIERVQDLLFHLPTRYEDRRNAVALNALKDGEEMLVRGRVEQADVRFAGRRSLRVLLDDDKGALLLRFFHFNEAQKKSFEAGRWVMAYGTVRFGSQGWEMVHPQYRVAESAEALKSEDRLTPIYPLTTGITQSKVGALVAQALEVAARDATFNATLPGLSGRDTLAALRSIHRPASDADAALVLRGQHPAQQRLIQEELLAHQLCMRMLRTAVKTRPAQSLNASAAAQKQLQEVLPFRFTGAQKRVMEDIAKDIAAKRPMLRLIQGDVGSGKTVVAAVAMLAAARAGWQAALMAPTELLAEQHLRNFRHWLDPLGVAVEWLAGKQQGKARAQALARVAGGAPVVIGTHALMLDGVAFARLGLVIVDEQHRFGVQQRLALRDKGLEGDLVPHQLVLTATPIPRTLAMSAYADLDVSSIDELPPGRTPVQTVAVSNARRAEVIERIHAACAEGRQAYWVCTLIEESEQLRAQAAEVAHAELCATLGGCSVRLIHGRMKPKEKQAVMDAFKAGELSVLVATTVIEVGVDVPNASLMVIENSERLGLAQLHQLRGRVGRGAVASNCVLLYQPPLGQLARELLNVML